MADEPPYESKIFRATFEGTYFDLFTSFTVDLEEKCRSTDANRN
jgi:hypothetical protein